MEGEYDGDRLSRLPGRFHLSRRNRENNFDIHADQLGRKYVQLFDCIRPTELNDNVLALDIAEVTQACLQRLYPVRGRRRGTETQVPDPRDLRRLLRARRERPSESCAAEERDDIPPPHSITSSARPRIEGGIVRPSALAVLRLITSWYLEACSTGRSAGLAPLRILSM